MENNYDDEFAITLTADRDFAIWWVLSVALALAAIMKNDDFKNKCLAAYKSAKCTPKRGEGDGK